MKKSAEPAGIAPGETMPAHEEVLSKRDYVRLCALIHAEAGIYLGTEKRTMLEGRIKRRLKALDLTSYEEYCNYLFGRRGMKEEMVHLIDAVTTNKTDFFREAKHFDFLRETALPEMAAHILGEIGEEAKSLTPVLRTLLQDDQESDTTRRHAAEALSRLDALTTSR